MYSSPFNFISMEEAAKIVSDALLGLDFTNIEIGGVVYTVKPPTIKTICMAISHFSKLEMEGENVIKAVESIPRLKDDMLKGLSCFIAGNESLAPALGNGTFQEVKSAMEVCLSMIDTSAFQCASLMRSVSKLAATKQ